MTAPLSQDLRERIARAVSDGSSIRQAAERFQVSPSAAIKLMQRMRETGSTAPAKIGGYRRPLLEPYADWLREMVCEWAGITPPAPWPRAGPAANSRGPVREGRS